MLYWDTDKLEELFRAEVFRLLLEKELIGRDTVNNMLSWKHSGFSADASVRVETIADAVRLGRYMIRSPLVLERLKWDDERGEVTYQARPKRSKGPSGGIARWDVLEFIARVTDHFPETGQQLTRNWGYYANASRAKRRRESGLPNSSNDTQNDQREQDRSEGSPRATQEDSGAGSGLGYAHRIVGQNYARQGLYSEAVPHYEQAVILDDSSYGRGWLGHAYSKSGRVDEAHSVLERLDELAETQYVSPERPSTRAFLTWTSVSSGWSARTKYERAKYRCCACIRGGGCRTRPAIRRASAPRRTRGITSRTPRLGT